MGAALRVSTAPSPTSHLRLRLLQDLVPHPGLHHHRGLVRLRAHVRDFCRLNPVHFAVGEAGLAIIENTLLANRHREPVYRPLQFQKRSQQFICVDNETLSVVAVRVNNPDRSPLGIHG